MSKELQSTKKQPTYDNATKDSVFRKSTFSDSGHCVEVAKDKDGVRVRDTKDRQGVVLSFTHEEWIAFLKGVNAGEFDV